ncbi:hypothetical protein ACFCYX_19655 [Streptomyces populi]|uniref:hypothetical protein n=1 Tax=Streptomyces populi TaxID=2058924 RepID=UPI0035D84B73
MGVDTWVQAGMAVVAAAGGVVSARSARRTKRQERRDDFTAVTDRMEKEIKRQGTALEEQQEQINGQGAAISWLVVDRRGLVSTIRGAGLKPPPARPIPDRAKPYLDSIDV